MNTDDTNIPLDFPELAPLPLVAVPFPRHARRAGACYDRGDVEPAGAS